MRKASGVLDGVEEDWGPWRWEGERPRLEERRLFSQRARLGMCRGRAWPSLSWAYSVLSHESHCEGLLCAQVHHRKFLKHS